MNLAEKINIGIPKLYRESDLGQHSLRADQQSTTTSMNVQLEWPEWGLSERQKSFQEAWQLNDQESSAWDRASTLTDRLVDFASEFEDSDSD